MTAHLKRTVVEVRGLHWATSKAIVEHVLLQRPGVASVGEDPVAQTATVSFDPSVTSVEQIPGWVRDCGYHCRGRIGPRPRLLPGGRNRAHFRDGARAAWIFFDCAYRALKARTLHISPQAVISASEVLSPHTALELEDAWGSAPFDVYAATETAGIASPCIYRNRHVYEDLLIIEPVDRAGNPVPEGTTGAKLLVTVLFSRTLPLIRYEMSDTVRLAGRGCPCGRAFTRLEDIEGRIEDVLQLPGKEGGSASTRSCSTICWTRWASQGGRSSRNPLDCACSWREYRRTPPQRGSAPRCVRPLPRREWCRPGWTCSWWITSNGQPLARHHLCGVYQAGYDTGSSSRRDQLL